MNMKKSVSDLGIGAYLMMHGYKVIGRKGKNVVFEINEKDTEEFERLTMDYLQSPFHQFDHYIMILKKVYESAGLQGGRVVADIGTGAYLMMNGYKIKGRKAKNLYFEVLEKDNEEFEKLMLDYTNSPYSQFDSWLMSLKKISQGED
jgi:regulator of sigma D